MLVAKEILRVAPWGVMWRVFLGAGLSILDLTSDVYVSILYLNQPGMAHFAYMTIGMVTANLFLQLVVCWIQHRKHPKAMLHDMLFVVTGLVCSERASSKEMLEGGPTSLHLLTHFSTSCSEIRP